MPEPRNYLRDRGLADGPDTPQPAPFSVDLQTGAIVPGETSEPPVASVGLPDDYAARLAAVEFGTKALESPSIDVTMFMIHRLHAFLTATEKPEPAEPTQKPRTFTDT